MEHIALYRQFRPMTFDEIVEQDGPVSSLRQAVKSDRIGHAYLFSGQRGTGKTSIAKVFSRAVNCESPVNGNPCNKCAICKGIIDGSLLDVIEIDAASNNSVDNIRRICEEVVFAPSKAKRKVYIIDEVHMLSQGAFNALLKTLEEPPAHVLFLFATTEPHRIPATILSRCQRFEFKRISIESIVSRLRFICEKEKFKADDDALTLIATLSDGAMRDAVSLLDQTGNSSPDKSVTRDGVLKITGTVDDKFLGKMAGALLKGDFETLINLCEELSNSGRDIIRFSLDLAQYFRDLLVVRMMPDPTRLVKVSTESLATMYDLCKNTSAETLAAFISKLSTMISDLKWSPSVRTTFEIALIQLCGRKVKTDIVPLVVPDYIKKQQEFAHKEAEKKPEEKKEEDKKEPETKAEEKTEAKTEEKPEETKPEEKKEESKPLLSTPSTGSSTASSPSSLFSSSPILGSLLNKTAPKVELPKKEEENKSDEKPENKAEDKEEKKEDDKTESKPSEDKAPSVQDIIPPPTDADAPPAPQEPEIPAPSPAPVVEKEPIDPEDLPMENQIDLFSMPAAPVEEPKPAPTVAPSPAPKKEESSDDSAPLLSMLSDSFLDDLGDVSAPSPVSGPTITHYDQDDQDYEEEVEEEPEIRPTTSLVQALEGVDLPVKKTPDKPKGGADLDAIWESIYDPFCESNYPLYATLRDTSLLQENEKVYIVFDDSYNKETLKDLTRADDYKKIRDNIINVLPGARKVFITTPKMLDNLHKKEEESVITEETQVERSPLEDYLQKAEQLGINLHFGDE